MNDDSLEAARTVLMRCSHVLLDMHGTFMFGHDRLSAREDFAATYRRLGGESLSPDEVSAVVLDGVAACRASMKIRDTKTPSRA